MLFCDFSTFDVLPPSGTPARPSLAYTELVEVLARATEKLSFDWPDEPCESQSSKLDEHFLSGSGSRQTRRRLTFFPDLHYEVSRSWKQPFSSRVTIATAADFTNLVGSVELGYAAVLAVEDTLAAHVSSNSAPSWKSSYCCEQRQRGFCPATVSLFSSAQRSNRRGLLFRSTPWLLQPVFSSPEEGWGFASYTRSAQTELLPLQREIQNAQEHSFPGPRG